MPTYFVVYQQPFLRKDKEGCISWAKKIKSMDAVNDTQATAWKNEILGGGCLLFMNRPYRRKLLRFAQQNGAHPRVLEGI